MISGGEGALSHDRECGDERPGWGNSYVVGVWTRRFANFLLDSYFSQNRETKLLVHVDFDTADISMFKSEFPTEQFFRFTFCFC